MNREEYKRQLWKEYVEGHPAIHEVQKEGCLRLGEKFLTGDVSFLYEVHSAFMEQERFRLGEGLKLEYEKAGEAYILRHEGEEWVFAQREFEEFLERMIGIFEEVLPLGSVVELKGELLPEIFPPTGVDKVRVVIVQRYVAEDRKEGYYYPYAGTVYPTGIPGSRKQIAFTPGLIERVVSRGYGDEQEEAYVFLMKRELFLERGLHAADFGGKEGGKGEGTDGYPA